MDGRNTKRPTARDVSPARRAAFRVLRDVGRRRGEPAALLDAFAYGELLPADRDLATEIVYGVLRWQARLDHVLDAHSRRPLAELDPTVVLALRVGLYQLTFLSRVPKHAAVDQSVRLARVFGASRGAGFVNAVLRSALRHPERPALPSAANSPLDFLATTLSHPRWLAERYLARLGLERSEALCRVQNEPPPTFCRVSQRLTLDEALDRLEREGVSSEPFELVPGCLRILAGRVQASSLFEGGLLYVQEAGAQLVPLLLAPAPGESVLDTCAAPGGKALQLEELVAPAGRVIALERRPARARLMNTLAARARAERLRTVVADGRALPLRAASKKILVDAPCTSLGTLRRNPDIKWRVRESDLAAMAELQLALLRSAAEHLAPGGRLVYATCSTEPEENEDVVRRFLAERPDVRQVDASSSLPPTARHLVGASGELRTSPERDGMDGYFAVVLTR